MKGIGGWLPIWGVPDKLVGVTGAASDTATLKKRSWQGEAARYVCAFRGHRDNYQVPLALAESGQLEALITDAYASAWMGGVARFLPGTLGEKIRFRREPRLPENRIRSLWGTALIERAWRLMGVPAARAYARLDARFSEAAARMARRTESNLLLYAPYAWEAFSAQYAHAPRKLLFQYHPHAATELEVLGEDAERHSWLGRTWARNLEAIGQASGAEQARVEDSWQLADTIICASSFTKKTLVEAGAEANRIRVVPYGVDVPAKFEEPLRQKEFQVLFVGTGMPRKGLHHLILAWRHASLPRDSELTLVCRVLDPAFEALVEESRNVRLIKGLPWPQLEERYRSATLFAMPSLIEGFGQVYLEALSFGLPVLGTANSCLPDLGDETDGIYCVEPGNVEQLSVYLERLSRELPGDAGVCRRAQDCAARFTWSRFRAQLRELL